VHLSNTCARRQAGRGLAVWRGAGGHRALCRHAPRAQASPIAPSAAAPVRAHPPLGTRRPTHPPRRPRPADLLLLAAHRALDDGARQHARPVAGQHGQVLGRRVQGSHRRVGHAQGAAAAPRAVARLSAVPAARARTGFRWLRLRAGEDEQTGRRAASSRGRQAGARGWAGRAGGWAGGCAAWSGATAGRPVGLARGRLG
jgi:hypothetical protein